METVSDIISPPRLDLIRMPGGLLIEVAADETIDAAFWRHAVLSISEGMCPLHQVPLQPVPSNDGGIGGRCAKCLRYWHTLPDGGAEWDTDHDPFTGRPEGGARVSREWAVRAGFDRMDWETPGFTDWLRDRLRSKLLADLEANSLTLVGEPAEHLRFLAGAEPFQWETEAWDPRWSRVDIALSARYRTAEEQREHWRQQMIDGWLFGARVAAMQPPRYSSIVLHPSL